MLLPETVISGSTVTAVSVVNALCFTVVGATYKMIQDNSSQIRTQVSTMIDDKTTRILDQVNTLNANTHRGFENVLQRLEKIDEHFVQYTEHIYKIEGQLCTAKIENCRST